MRRCSPLFVKAAFIAVIVAFSGSFVQAQERQTPASEAQVKLSFSPVVKSVAPAVVNVYASRTVQQRQYSPFFDDPFFKRFFGGQGGLGAPRTRKRVERSLGSGVIISKDGVIITNHHVIAGADQVRVALSDKREFDADIVLKDERTDLAVLRIKEKGAVFPFVEFADSDELEVGDLVLAIGNPFGVGQTVTQGIVSALARTQVGVSDYQFFIQTDAAINPGNSGGALVDIDGRLIGINTAIFTRSGGSNGIGFAIPANMVKFVAAAADNGSTVRRPWIGASLQAVNSDIADSFGLDRPKGVLVTRVFDDSPAMKAGLLVGDLILSVGKTPIDNPDSFGYRLATKKLGSKVAFKVFRDGEEVNLKVRLIAAPETTPRDKRTIKGRSPFSGAVVMNLSPAVAEELRMPEEIEGVVVESVTPGSSAEYVGFRRGDIIMSANSNEIMSAKQLDKIAAERSRVWRIEIRRDGQVRRMSLRL